MSDNEKIDDKSKLRVKLMAGVLAGAMSLNVLFPTAAISAEEIARLNNSEVPEALTVPSREDFETDVLARLLTFENAIMPTSEEDGDDEENGGGAGPGTGGSGGGLVSV